VQGGGDLAGRDEEVVGGVFLDGVEDGQRDVVVAAEDLAVLGDEFRSRGGFNFLAGVVVTVYWRYH